MNLTDPKDMLCPKTRKKCLAEKCPLYIRITGKDPQSEDMMSQNVCAEAVNPLLLIEMTQVMRGLQSSFEGLRNQTANVNDHIVSQTRQIRQIR